MENTGGPRQWGPGQPGHGPKRSPDSRSVQNTPIQTKKRRSEEREAKDESMPPQQLEAAMNVAITSEIESKIHDIVEERLMTTMPWPSQRAQGENHSMGCQGSRHQPQRQWQISL